MNRKHTHRAAILKRAERALSAMYHNATPNYPSLDEYEARRFESWFDIIATHEIGYIQNGGTTPGDYRKTLEHAANGGGYKSDAARRFYVQCGLRKRDEERADCGMLTGWRALEVAAGNPRVAALLAAYPGATRNDAQWERISEYGKLYTWGRGGRTLAPDGLVSQRGGSSFSIRIDAHDEMPIARVVEMIRIVESFNAYVRSWNRAVPDLWSDHCAVLSADARREADEVAYWEARDVATWS